VTLPPAPVTDLNYVEQVLSPEPLWTQDELDRFYRKEVNEVRGKDAIVRLATRYRQAFGAAPYKTFVMGHPGVGKSTEMTRLLCLLRGQYEGIRSSIARELNPASFKVFDILLLVMIKAVEETKAKVGAGLLENAEADSLIADLLRYFAEEKVTQVEKRTIGGEVQAGVKADSLWWKILPVFASVKGEIKYASDRSDETIPYRLKRLPELVQLANRLLAFCADCLKRANGKEWLFILEDFDRFGISVRQLEEVFVQFGTVFQDLQANLIFTIPVWMSYSQDANRLPFPKSLIPDTPVYDRYHVKHQEGRQAVRAVLNSRVAEALIEPDQADRLIVASGGNLRDLFAMMSEAAGEALSRNPSATRVGEREVTKAIDAMRREYRMRLGEGPQSKDPIAWEEKSRKLVAVYRGEVGSDIPDKLLYFLLRARAVQEFNGEGWFGVHPLVVDILKEQKILEEGARGGSR
jgi:hypothetical protein